MRAAGDFVDDGARALPPLALIAPVWGSRHTQRFIDLVLPSWLGRGNLDALAERPGLRLKIVTTAADAVVLQRSAVFAAVGELAPLDIVAMDDLVVSASAFVSLTLAYQRGLRHAAAAADPVMAVLLNADFVLAQGSLAALLDVLDRGARVVLAPSLRAVEQDVEHRLLQGRRDDGTLSLSPREMVALAFEALHPTVICSRVDQQAVQSLGPHQLFWRAEPGTLVGRAFCLFPLAIEVCGPVGPAETFCDYGLAPLLAPDAEPVVMNDSDAFFALELAPRDQEARFFHLGAATRSDLAERIGAWSVAFHRAQAAVPMFYRAAGPGAAVAAATAASAHFVSDVAVRMADPQPLRHHPHWLAAVALWRTEREEHGLSGDPPELGAAPDVRVAPTADPIRRAARALLVGDPRRRRWWHPRWRLGRAITERLQDETRRGPVLFLGRALLADFSPLAAQPQAAEDAEAACLWLSLDSAKGARMDAALSEARGALAEAVSATVLALCEGEGAVSETTISRLVSWLDADMDICTLQTFDLRLDERVRHVHGRLADQFTHVRWERRLVLLGMSSAALTAMALINLARMLVAPRRQGCHVSAILLTAVRREGPVHPEPAVNNGSLRAAFSPNQLIAASEGSRAGT